MSSAGIERISQQSDIHDVVNTRSSRSRTKVVQFNECVQQGHPIIVRGWHERAICQLHNVDCKLDELIPNFSIQTRIDELGSSIEQLFAPLVTFNNWLNSNGHGAWYRQLACYLVTLPVYAARNIIQQVYTIIRGIVYGTVHPLKGLNNVAKMLVTLTHELTKPETWAKMGAGTIGTSMGQAAIGGNLLSLVGIGIGGAMVVGGVSLGALKAAFYAEQGQYKEAVGQNLLTQACELSEVVVTGFAMGLIIEGIKRAISTRPKDSNVETKPYRHDELKSEGKSKKALTASSTKSSKKPKPSDAPPTQKELELAYLMWERSMLIDILKNAKKDYLAMFAKASPAAKQAAEAQVPNLILGILIDYGTPGALELASEIIDNKYKIPSK